MGDCVARHHTGNKLEFLKTSVFFGLKHDDLCAELRAWLREPAETLWPIGSRRADLAGIVKQERLSPRYHWEEIS
ncbi:MAG: hypothetical protein ACOCW3_06025 [Spirochaetota bacterium]